MKSIDLQMQKLLVIKKTTWQNWAIIIKAWIEQDMIAGKVQAFIAQVRKTKGGAQQYSASYKKYKQNLMRRLSTRKHGAKVRVDGKIMVSTKAYIGAKGSYLKGMNNVIDSSGTPNMRLTGETIKALKYLSSTDQSLTMTYADKDSDKIIWNKDMGRLINTLSEDNQDGLVKLIEGELVKNISDWYKDKIIITLGK